jgi:uncharacterized protein YjbI with pentapeptide repeats
MLAPVVPRVRAAGTGPDAAALPLHDRIRAILDGRWGDGKNPRGVVSVIGPGGSGKTVALGHLAVVLDRERLAEAVDLIDGGPFEPAELRGRHALVVYASHVLPACPVLSAFEMAPWAQDDCIEYLLSTHRERCRSVLKRLGDAVGEAPLAGVTASAMDGLPELWRIVLDEMAEDESVATPAEALRHFLAAHLTDPTRRDAAMAMCLRSFCTQHPENEPVAADVPDPAELARLDPFMGRLVRFRAVRALLAGQRIVWELCDVPLRQAQDGAADIAILQRALACRLPRDLVAETAALVRHRPLAARALETLIAQYDSPGLPAVPTLLLAADAAWRPAVACPNLRSAGLENARWAGTDLRGADMSDARLNGADLSGARLDGAKLGGAWLGNANLTGASLRKARASHATLIRACLASADAEGANFEAADLTGADLTGANLTAAAFHNADLSDAQFCQACLKFAIVLRATLEGADFSGADFTGARLSHVCLRDCLLDGAIFREANLLACDLEEIELCTGDFHAAALTGSLLTGSTLPGADFSGADLRDTGLADVSWEGVDLRDADLTGASFHAGSTRCGMVGAPGTLPASEGTRTGFYTDDLAERDFKPPEEIRKADLRNADLRGAQVLKVDFYLVDLRGARYGRDQERHFKRCGAIL